MAQPNALLKEFFNRDVCQRATAPLRDGIEIQITVDGEPGITLRKQSGRVFIEDGAPAKPDMSFTVGKKAPAELTASHTDDIGEIGVVILKLMAHSDPEYKIRAKVHIGLFNLLRNGYFSVLPLGGATVTKFLASKGFSSLGKIKEAISNFRE